MPLFGKKENSIEDVQLSKDDFKEIEKIKDNLTLGERVLVVATQGRLVPGGAITTPNTIFATDKRVLIRNPTMLGMRASVEEIPYDKITSVKLEKGFMSATIIIRSPGLSELTRMGRRTGLIAWGRGEEGSIDAIPRDKGEQLLKIIREGMEKARTSQTLVHTVSVAEEIKKLAELKDSGIITDEEFEEKKKKLLEKI